MLDDLQIRHYSPTTIRRRRGPARDSSSAQQNVPHGELLFHTSVLVEEGKPFYLVSLMQAPTRELWPGPRLPHSCRKEKIPLLW
jgi:hypothetical protein